MAFFQSDIFVIENATSCIYAIMIFKLKNSGTGANWGEGQGHNFELLYEKDGP